jgi:MFS family permease
MLARRLGSRRYDDSIRAPEPIGAGYPEHHRPVTVLLLAVALFLVQAGDRDYTASLPLALARGGVGDAAIGLIVGAAAIVQIPAAIVGGRLVDGFGGVRLFALGAGSYMVGSLIILLPGVETGGSPFPFVVARLFQGAGVALTLPSALSLVPTLVTPAREPNGLSIVGAAHNLTLVVAPPLSIVLLDRFGLKGVAAGALVTVGVGLLLFSRLGLRAPARPATASPRRYGIVFRRSWAVPLLIVVFYVAHWGAVTAYLPVRAASSGADVGLYFAADGVAIFLMRLPTAWLANRIASRWLIVAGATLTAVAIGMLLLPLTTPLLIASGLLGGGAGAMILSPVLFEINRRSTAADRGSAFALYSGSLAVAISLGSIGGAPIVAVFGLSAALAGGIVLIGVSIALALADPSLRSVVVRTVAATPRPGAPGSPG